MPYAGQIGEIKFGQQGLISDISQDDMPLNSLIVCENTTMKNGVAEKEFGSQRWNSSALPDRVLAFTDYFPVPLMQRVFALCANGKVYRFENKFNSAEVTAQGSSPSVLSLGNFLPSFVEGGNEVIGNPKKLFIFSGNSPIQVIEADDTTRNNLNSPSPDWATTPPTHGLIYRGRLWAISGHNVYASEATDHENFTGGNALFYSVFPGEGDRNLSLYTFAGRLFVFKYPYGVYYLNDQDASSTNWYFEKLSNNFGLSSPLAITQSVQDVYILNSTGSITSMAAAFKLGDIESADVLNQLKVENFVRENSNSVGFSFCSSFYYSDKKIVYFTFRTFSSSKQDAILAFDMNGQLPKVSWITKDQPTCIGGIRDNFGVFRPFYGADDGYLYEMDRPNRSVNSSGYQMQFQTPHMDFGISQNKIFDQLEIHYEPTGNWNVSVDVYIDSKFIETISFNLYYGAVLDSFVLDRDQVLGRGNRGTIKRLHGRGQTISFKFRNNTADQNVKIPSMHIYYRVAGQDDKAGDK